MARLNLDDELFGDERFKLLVTVLGDEEKAIGKMVRLFRIGQIYWRKNKLIPEHIFMKSGFECTLDVELAQKRQDGVYVCGAEKRWNWLLDLEEKASAAGKASAAARREKYGSANPRSNQTKLKSVNGSGTACSQNDVNSTVNGCSQENVNKFANSENVNDSRTGCSQNVNGLGTTREQSVNALSLVLVNKTHTTAPTVDTPTVVSPSPKELAKLWNEITTSPLPKVDLSSFDSDSKRWKSAKARLKKKPDLEYWRQVITKMNLSLFLRGNGKDDGWKANFDFLIRPDTPTKVLEGNYDSRKKGTTVSSDEYFDPARDLR